MNARFSAKSDIGAKRKINEDSYLVEKDLSLFVVCDGMGGHAAGEVASALAVRTLREVLLKQCREIEHLAKGQTDARRKLRDLLREAVKAASMRIYQQARRKKEHRGMGTTLTLLLIEEQRAFVAHVGDSRLYLCRSGAVHQITTDHNLVNELIRAGRLSPEEAENAPMTNALTRAVGVYPNVDVDTLELDLMAGDKFLLCSDGLHGYLDDALLLQGFENDLSNRADWFVDLANKSGGKDNITAVLIDIGEVRDPEASQRVRLTIETLHTIPLFQHLSYAELVRVIGVSRAKEFAPKHVIIREGDEGGDALYVILEGEVEVTKKGVLMATLDGGRHFGEQSLVDNQPRSATVVTSKPTLLIRITRPDFYELLRQDSVMAVKLLWNFVQTLSQRLRAAAPDTLDGGVEPIDSLVLHDTVEMEPPHPYESAEHGALEDAVTDTVPEMEAQSHE